jgi:hypothetical protein
MARLKVTLDELNSFLDNSELLFSQQSKGPWNKKLTIKITSPVVGSMSIIYIVYEQGEIKIETYNKLIAINFYNDLEDAKS